jgi:hypothetical protein
MAKTFIIVLGLLLSTAWLPAQNQNPQTGSSQTGTAGQTTIQGCLQESKRKLHPHLRFWDDLSAAGRKFYPQQTRWTRGPDYGLNFERREFQQCDQSNRGNLR